MKALHKLKLMFDGVETRDPLFFQLVIVQTIYWKRSQFKTWSISDNEWEHLEIPDFKELIHVPKSNPEDMLHNLKPNVLYYQQFLCPSQSHSPSPHSTSLVAGSNFW